MNYANLKIVDTLNNDSVTILKYAASITIPHCGYNPYTKPYWNSDVKTAHSEERHKRKCWVTDGRPRGMYFESNRNYKRAKSNFRNVQYTAYECHIRLFWKLIRKQKPRASNVYSEIIHKNTTNNNLESIVDAFADYFYELYQPNKDDAIQH
jgi:hypothetical protein